MRPLRVTRFVLIARALRPIGAVALASTLVAAPSIAHAQVSDAQRAVARQLFQEGNDLQAAGKYADALDKFQKAQDAFSAPTNLVRVAECQVSLGRLVEGAETYRTVIRTPLPAGSPPAFAQSVDQAKTELAQVEPRVPKVTVQVTPKDVAGLRLQIDGQQVTAALVGEPLPLDPGTHKVAVFASGYVANEQTVTISERDTKTLVFRLSAVAGVTIAPAPPLAPAPPAPPQDANGQPIPPPPPPVDEARGEFVERRRPANTSFLLGPRIGVETASGDFTSGGTADNSENKISNIASTGGTFAADAGFRFSRFYIGVSGEYSGYSRGSDPNALVGSATSAQTVTLSSWSGYAGLSVAYISNPNGVGFYGELGFGHRWMNVTGKVADSTGANYFQISDKLDGNEFELGLGVYVRATRNFVLIPKVTASIGSFGNVSTSCTANGAASCPASATSSGTLTDDQTSTHTFFFLGVGGYYNLDFH
jgi:hypothetical protein